MKIRRVLCITVAVSILIFQYSWAEAEKGVAPFHVSDMFYPSGRMGDHGDIKMKYLADEKAKAEGPRYCQQWTYTAKVSQGAGWAGVAWQYPENNWGAKKGHVLTGYKKVSFRIKGMKGGESVETRIGGDNNSLNVTYGPIKLTAEWTEHTIDISKEDLSNVSCGFYWAVAKTLNPDGCSFCIENIIYE